MLDFLDNQEPLEEFLKLHVKPYTDDYDRPPFTADIKEGKNDPIYNAHSYHTKVPPRGILPYILHYTKPGDLVLDPFCGSGMTGVASQMCVTPPADILAQFPDLKDRVGPRACILNDLSPAACHIAYNYNTPVDIDTLKREFERVKAAVKEEFAWLYGTEHYEPAFGDYALTNPEVLARLKNPPDSTSSETGNSGDQGLLFSSETERAWTILTRLQVEERLGYPVTDLPRDDAWKDVDVSKVNEWICAPATIQYTIWSDVYRCEGFVTIEEPTGKISNRGRNVGKPLVTKKRVTRGCGTLIVLWQTALVPETGAVLEVFRCPNCGQEWKKIQLTRCGETPVETYYAFQPKNNGGNRRLRRYQRRVTANEKTFIEALGQKSIPYWFPDDAIDMGREMLQHGLQRRGKMTIADFFFKRQLWALGRLWHEFSKTETPLKSALKFLFTSLHNRYSKRTKWHKSRFGQGSMPNNLYIPSLMVENNILNLCVNKFSDICTALSFVGKHPSAILVLNGDATSISTIPDASVDYVFADPPFGQNIYYADCSLLWEGWLKEFTDESKEIVVSERRSGDTFKELSEYKRLMTLAFAEMYRVLKPNRWATIEFNNSDGAVFEAIKSAVTYAGFEIVNMLLLDKDQKTYKQIQGAKGEAEVVDKDVLFNLHKPISFSLDPLDEKYDLEQQIVGAVRCHLQSLPDRIKTDPIKYSDDHRTTATINSMLMNTLIPKGISVQCLNFSYIEQVCARYFRKVGQRWYSRGEAIGNGTNGALFEEEVQIKDEESAIAWLRQRLTPGPKTVGELKPLWMRATGLLPLEISQQLYLDALLRENFWKDADTNRWREPTPEEREKMNDSRTLHVLRDAERFLVGSLKRQFSDSDRCDWIEVLFKACRSIEERENEELPALRDFDPGKGYQMISQLFHGILKDHLPIDMFIRAEKQARVASSRLKDVGPEEKQEKKESKNKMQQEFDW